MSHPPRIAQHSYGKSRVCLTKLTRHPDRHDLKEIAVEILLEGDFEASYLTGDNRLVVPTDTMKNTVYALAAGHPLDSIESFTLTLVEHFLNRHPQVTAATARIEEVSWRRIENADGGRHPPCLYRRRHRSAALQGAGRPLTAAGRGGREQNDGCENSRFGIS